MNWLSNITPPGIKNIFKRPDNNSDTLWVKCKGCGEMVFQRDLELAHHVCPSCSHHMLMSPEERLKFIFDDKKFDRIELPDAVHDPLKFKDTKKYADRLKEHRKRTGEQDGLVAATGTIDDVEVVAAVQNFGFMGGSMGIAVGEGFVRAAEVAVEKAAPLIMFTASGGARMQESILALMQMPRTTIAVEMLRDAGLPFIVVLTNPTTGGVMASFAMLGDVHIAEPGALLGFAGRRVIEQTIREKLPQEFQKSEFLLEKGMVDIVVHRHDLKVTLAKLVRVLTNFPQRVASADGEPHSKPDTGIDTHQNTVKNSGDNPNAEVGKKPNVKLGVETPVEAALVKPKNPLPSALPTSLTDKVTEKLASKKSGKGKAKNKVKKETIEEAEIIVDKAAE